MKKLNLIERLLSYSHEKQSPQRFGRYAVMLIMLLTLGVGQMWAAKVTVKFKVTGWTKVYAYTWDGDNNGSWPGGEITSSLSNGWYSYNLTSGAKIIFNNNGGKQTNNIENVTEDVCYIWVDDTKKEKKDVNCDGTIDGSDVEYFYRGTSNSWGATKMTQHALGLYSYIGPYSQNDKFKIALSSGGWDYGWDSNVHDLTFNGGVASGLVRDEGNYKISPSGSYYIMVYHPNTSLNNTSSVKINIRSSLYNPSYDITYKDEGNVTYTGSNEASLPSSYTYGTGVSLTDGEKTGYDFDGWFNNSGCTGDAVTSVSTTATGDKTFYADWTEKTYSLTFSHNGHGTISVGGSEVSSGSTASVNYFTTKTLVADPDDGYHFTGWTLSGTNTSAVTIADVSEEGASTTIKATNTGATVTAGFAADAANSLTVSAGTGISAVTGSDADISAGDDIDITATVADGYTWDRWTLSGSGTLSTFTATTKNQTVTVGTAGNMTLTASATENMSALSVSRTIDEGSPSIAAPTVTGSYTTVGYVTTRTITAAAAATGYALTSWTITNGTRTDGGGATANPITVRSNGDSEDVTVTANYSIQSYTISASNSNVTYSPASGTSFEYGATGKKMTITPKSGYRIANITSNNGAISASADNNAAGSWSVTGTMPAANVTLTVTTAALSTIYLQGRFRIRTASGVESYKSLGSATAENWSSEWVTGGTSQISMIYNYITGFYDLVTYRSAAELKADGNLYFYLRVGSTNTYPTSDNLTVPSSIPGSANAQTSTGRNFYFNDGGDYINVVLHYDDANKKLWYTGEAETVYSTTCYAGDHGSINVKGTAISKNNSRSINIGTSNPISATPESGYSFDYWETTGSVTVADIYSASTTVTASAESGTVRAHYLANTGWYLHGVIDGYDTWEHEGNFPKERPVDRPYRGISGVYYRRITNLNNDAYFGIHDCTNKYSGHESTSSDYEYTTLNIAVQLYVNSSKSFQAKSDFSNKWVVIKTNDTKKFWIQNPTTYYTLSKSSDHGTLTLTENSYGGLETSQFASGERVNYSITAASGYVIDDIKIGNTTLFSDVNTASKSGNTTMPAGNTTFTVTYVPIYTVTYHDNGKTSGSAPVDASSPYIAGSDVTVLGAGTLQMTNYTFSGWNTAQYMTGTTYAAAGTISDISANVNLYPVWTRAIPMENEDATTDVSTTVYGTYMSTTLTDYDNPEKIGYTFGGWYTAVAGGDSYVISPEQVLQASKYHWTDASGRFDRNPSSTSSLYAKWTQTITLNANTSNHGSGSNTSAEVIYKKNALTSITHCTPAAGYSLAGYYTAATGGTKILEADGTFAGSNVSDNTEDYIVGGVWKHAGATILYAQYSEIMRTVAVTVNNAYLGTVSTASLTDVGPATASAEVTATPTPGATLTNWTLPSGVTAAATYSASSNPISVNATAAGKTITANFTETMHTVTLTNDNSTYGTVNTSSPLSVGQITAVQIQATPKSGYMFSKWVKTAGAGTVTYYTGAGNGQVTDASGDEKEITYICVTGDVTLKATWEPDRSSGYVVYYGNDGKNADGKSAPSQARAWKDGKLYRPTTEESNTSSFTFTAGVADVDQVIEFKVHKKTSPEAWYGYNSASGGKIDGNISNVTLNTSYGNGRLCITMPGSYTFTWNKSNNQLSISYPTDVYYVRGGWDSWSWSHPMTETSSGVYEATINMTEANHTYTANTEAGFKVLIAGQYYGKNGTTFTRASSTGSAAVSECNTSGQNMGLTTDYTGNYTFTYNTDGNELRITYPTAYKVTYGKGSVDGSASNCSAVDIDNSSAAVTSNSTWVKSGNRVVLTAPAAKEGYTYNGWFDNNSGTGEAITTAANCTITVSSAETYYACYSINNHSITHSAATNGSYTIKVGSLDPVSTNTTADYAQTITLAATPATGYHFTTWSVAKSVSGTVTPSPNATTTPATFSMPDDNVTVSATFAANNYTISLNNHGATTAGTTSVSVTYNATTGLTSDITAPEKDGYTFGGYYTEEGGSGTQLISAAGKWQKSNAWINAGGNWVNAGDVELHAKWTANNYTVTFDAKTNGGTCDTDDKEVTFGSAYGELPTAVHSGDDSFLGWYTTASGEGSLVTEETIVSIAGNHTLYARFETTFEVVVQFKCGSDVLYPETRVNASLSSLTPTITAPDILGYAFSSWTETGGSYVTFADASASTTTINASGAATVVANYTVVPTVYFKNNLGWENVYVTFDAYFDGSRQNAPGSYGKPYFQMTQIGSSDIFYCEIPSTYTASDYASWANTIAFDNTGFDASANVGTKTGAFDSGEFIGRGDFDPRATMFIPYDGDTESRNGGTFFRTGCWIQYNTNYSGYKVHVNSNVQGGGGTSTEVQLRSDIAGSTEFTATVNLTEANYTYGVMLYKDYLKNTSDIWYTNVNDAAHTITSATTSLPWAFIPCTDSWQRCRVHTESLGDYKFTVSFATGKPMVDIEYPVTVGDWKLVYKDRATWSGDAHSASWCHPSRVIKAKADAEDIVSFYVAYGSTPSIELHKCTAIDGGTGAQTWTKQSDVSLTGITKKGIYNFKVSQDGSKVATVTYDGEYAGNFYVRTDASDGGWSNYKTSGTNLMTYSEYAETEHDYTHYFMRFVTAGSNIKFCIANDYSECISDTLVSDTYTNEWLEAYANVRFMWNKGTNVVSRAYISGSSNVSDRFLVLEGDDKMYDENGNALTTAGGGKVSGLNDYEMKFTDDQNWIYEATVKAQPGARIKLTAKYNTKIQYFYGDEGARTDETTELLIGGSGTDKYKVRVVYDFKTNRLIKAFIPDGAIGTDLEIDADLMIIRDHQADAQQVTFSEGGALSEVKTVYGAMKFNKYTVNNKNREAPHGNAGLSRYTRDLFYISFPFDVKLSDVFGFGTYGKHWILEYYDGKGRAANGFWADSDPNWKFVMPSQRNSFTMKAFEGYILALDLDEMTESSPVWNNNVENVYIYFPSSAEVEDIEATNRLIEIDQDGYECTINRPTPDGDRRVKDSYWHCIGVPSFANYNRDLTVTNGGATIDWSDDDGTIDWSTPSLPYLYEVNWSNNTLNVTTSATFNFKATWSYLVQYAGATIYWSQVNVTPASIVARERKAPTNAEFRIELQKAGQKADQTFVRLTEDENVTNGFDFNYDLSKEFNKNQANIYTLVTTVKEGAASVTQSAANVLPMTEQTTVIPVGVKIAASGDYTFAIPEGTNGVGVALIDNETGIQTPLSALDYTVNLSAGTYDERFVLVISPIKDAPTGIEEVADDVQVKGARKVLIDGLLYIVKDGKMFDAQGHQVK